MGPLEGPSRGEFMAVMCVICLVLVALGIGAFEAIKWVMGHIDVTWMK